MIESRSPSEELAAMVNEFWVRGLCDFQLTGVLAKRKL